MTTKIPPKTIQQIKAYIKTDKLSQACDLFKSTFLDKEALGLKGRLTALKQDKMRGVLETQEADLLRNKTRNDLLLLVEQLESGKPLSAEKKPGDDSTPSGDTHIHNYGNVGKQVNNPNIAGDLNM